MFGLVESSFLEKSVTTPAMMYSKESPVEQTAIPMGTAPAMTHPVVSCQATASLVCGIVGILFAGFIMGPIAIYLAYRAKKMIHENPTQVLGQCQATAGLVTGIVAIVVWLLVIPMAYA